LGEGRDAVDPLKALVFGGRDRKMERLHQRAVQRSLRLQG